MSSMKEFADDPKVKDKAADLETSALVTNRARTNNTASVDDAHGQRYRVRQFDTTPAKAHGGSGPYRSASVRDLEGTRDTSSSSHLHPHSTMTSANNVWHAPKFHYTGRADGATYYDTKEAATAHGAVIAGPRK